MQKPASQVCAAHSELITAVAASRRAEQPHESAVALIEQYRNDGWVQLAHVLTTWLNGAEPDIARLDAEDQQIAFGIEYAARHPEWLATLADEARQEAATAIAQMIFAATWGDHDALDVLSSMREAAQDAGIENSAAHAFVAIVEGERDEQRLQTRYDRADPDLLAAVTRQVAVLEAE